MILIVILRNRSDVMSCFHLETCPIMSMMMMIWVQGDDSAQAIHTESRRVQLWDRSVGVDNWDASLPEHDSCAGSLCGGEQGCAPNHPPRLPPNPGRDHDTLLGHQPRCEAPIP